jgi:nanoRNase/pAp phosphatase (c-di-AMP/oligoRNAs hydrolase)
MKIVLLGRGHRMVDILESFHAPRADVAVISSDPTTLHMLAGRPYRRIAADPALSTLAEHGIALGPNDLILVTEYEEPTLRAILANLRNQNQAAVCLVFTPLGVRELAKEFPEFLIRSDRLLYKTEMRDLIRRTGSQQKVNAIRRIVREAGRAVVIIWGNPDPDALASAFALRELLVPDCPDFTISYLGEFGRPENLAMVGMLKIPTVKHTPALIGPGTATITVDAQPSFFSVTGAVSFDVIIDHHPTTVLGPHRFADVRPRYGSTSTILTEYYRDSAVRMPRRVATALYYGLKVDTANLTRNVSDADVIAFRFLHPRADANLIRTIELSQLPLSTLDFFQIAIANKKITGDTAFAYVGMVENPDICVHIADFFIKLSGISWAVVACRTPEKVVIVFRSDGFRKHAGKVAEGVFIDYGTAGGHRTMARAELPQDRLKAEAPEMSDVAIENWLLSKLSTRLKGLGKFLGTHAATKVR